MPLHIPANNDPQSLLDNDLSLRCPHCGVHAGMTAVSIPRYELVIRFKLREVGIGYRCDACNKPVFLQFQVEFGNPLNLSQNFVQVQSALEPFEHKYLPQEVGEDFREGLKCYSHDCWNAFAAMCRRCLQSVANDLGADGSTKVDAQLRELKDMGVADEETFTQLKQIMLAGHDGAHPHLPKLSPERATVLLQLMKDVLYQLYVRPGKIREAAALRAAQRAGSSLGSAA